MSVWTVCVVCLLCALMGKMLERYNREYALGLTVLCCCGIALVALAALLPLRDELARLTSGDAALSSSLKLLMKGLGVCYLAGFASAACRDAGETALSHHVEIVARIAVVGLYLPVLLDLLKEATDWLGGSR